MKPIREMTKMEMQRELIVRYGYCIEKNLTKIEFEGLLGKERKAEKKETTMDFNPGALAKMRTAEVQEIASRAGIPDVEDKTKGLLIFELREAKGQQGVKKMENEKLTFGKYKEKTWKEAYELEGDYAGWAIDEVEVNWRVSTTGLRRFASYADKRRVPFRTREATDDDKKDGKKETFKKEKETFEKKPDKKEIDRKKKVEPETSEEEADSEDDSETEAAKLASRIDETRKKLVEMEKDAKKLDKKKKGMMTPKGSTSSASCGPAPPKREAPKVPNGPIPEGLESERDSEPDMDF